MRLKTEPSDFYPRMGEKMMVDLPFPLDHKIIRIQRDERHL